MSNYERTETEKSGERRTRTSREEMYKIISNSIVSEENEKKARAREAMRRQMQGNGKYINI